MKNFQKILKKRLRSKKSIVLFCGKFKTLKCHIFYKITLALSVISVCVVIVCMCVYVCMCVCVSVWVCVAVCVHLQ